MGSFRLENDQDNIWSGNLLDFNANVANNFYSYGFPSGYDALTQGGGGVSATVVFQSSDFFSNVVDADRGIDFSNLAPSDFSFVSSLFSGSSGLPSGSYSAAQL